MAKYIPLDALVAEINRVLNSYDPNEITSGRYALVSLRNSLDTLEVKEVEESKLPNPRFPHLDNIVDKVFGTGNLESFEYEEAKQLVLLLLVVVITTIKKLNQQVILRIMFLLRTSEGMNMLLQQFSKVMVAAYLSYILNLVDVKIRNKG